MKTPIEIKPSPCPSQAARRLACKISPPYVAPSSSSSRADVKTQLAYLVDMLKPAGGWQYQVDFRCLRAENPVTTRSYVCRVPAWYLPRDAIRRSAVMPWHVVFLSVCPSVTMRYEYHISWNISKIISRLIILGHSLDSSYWTSTSWVYCKGNTTKF